MPAWLAVPLVIVVLAAGAAGGGALIFDGKGWPAVLAGVGVLVLTAGAVASLILTVA